MERKPAKSFQDLIVWQKAHRFVLQTYRETGMYPKTEIFGLSAQFRRAAVSIAANIAEGFKKKGKADKLRFYNIAQGSLEECRYYLMLSRDLMYYSKRETFALLEEVSKLLEGYIDSITSGA